LQQASHGRVPAFSSQKATAFSFFLTFIQVLTWNIRVVKYDLRRNLCFSFERWFVMFWIMTSPEIKL
jgi:hypothetical protein